jgi:MFS family permease
MRGEQLIAAIRWHDSDEEWKFAPHERPTVPGAPANPDHPLGLRYAYGVIAVLVGITAGLGNALVSVNLLQLQGALGGYVDEIAWLPAVYVMTNISMNLLLIRFRQQFGLRLFTGGFVALYAVVTLGHIFVRTFATAIAVRAASGMAAASLTSLTLFYTVQALPAKWRLRATVIGISIPQIATPLARLFSTELLALGEWRALYIFEFGLALMTLAAVLVLRLPPGERQQVFEPLDFVSFGLFAGGMALFSAVIGEGRYLWWTDTPWLGWALSGSIVLVVAAIVLDYYRRRPLIATRWLTSADMMRFVVVGILMRLALSEQSYAAVGLLNTLGFNNDQFHPLFWIATAAIISGSIASGVLLDVKRLTQPIMISLVLVAVAAGMDSDSTNLTRPQELYLSQALLAFSSTFCLGPSLLFGLGRSLKKGAIEYITFFALFSITLNLGNLMGTSLLGTFQIIREKVHSNAIVQQIVLTDPQVETRFQQSELAYSAMTIDPAARGAEGAARLSEQVTREANILAYNDVFQLIAVLSLATALYLAVVVFFRRRRERRAKAALQ